MAYRSAGAILALGLCLAACGGESEQAAAPAANNTAAADPAAMPDCPYRETRDWNGWVEAGRVHVNGNVDLQMAGFRPALTVRPGAAPGTLALDLAMAPEPAAPVNDLASYQGSAGAAARRAEIWCGGRSIAEFDITHIN